MSSVEIMTHRGIARFPSIRSTVEADLRGWLPAMGVMLPEEESKGILEKAEAALGPYVSGEESVMFDLSAPIIAGSKS